MQRSRTKIEALAALGLASALALDASVAAAQEADTPTTPKAPEASAPAKTGETRPGPLDVIVMFNPGTAVLQADSRATLDEVAEWLDQDPTRTATIEAHPDERTSADFDASLDGQRGDTTKAYLLEKGSAEGQVATAGSESVAPDTAGRNHRTIFMMSGKAKAVAVAPEPEPEPMVAPQSSAREDDDASDDHLITRIGMAATVGGGVVDFLDGEARDLGDMGGAWEARLTVGTRLPVAIEAAYVGSVHNIDALGLDTSAVLLGTAVETDLRVNFTTWMLQPYVFGGIGYTRYNVSNEDFNTSSVNDQEEMGHIPVGAGLGYQFGGLLVDLRGTLRPAFQDDLVDEPATEDDPLDDSDTATDLDTWSVAARLGWEF
jgi:outer membrane protein OmpA-like peptidoglycan-associated protein